MNKSQESGLLMTIPATIMGLGAFGAGAYLGYQRAGYHTFDDPLTGTLLKFLPVAIESVVCGVGSGLYSLVDSLRSKSKKGLKQVLFDALESSTYGGALGAGVGGLATYLGYRTGYFVG